jgi:hypothetical protein
MEPVDFDLEATQPLPVLVDLEATQRLDTEARALRNMEARVIRTDRMMLDIPDKLPSYGI